MKVPAHRHATTVAVYRDTLGLQQSGGPTGQLTGFKPGPVSLWIDSKLSLNRADLRVQIVTEGTAKTAAALCAVGPRRSDEVAPPGAEIAGFRVSNPASRIHLGDRKDTSRDAPHPPTAGAPWVSKHSGLPSGVPTQSRPRRSRAPNILKPAPDTPNADPDRGTRRRKAASRPLAANLTLTLPCP